MKFLLICLIIVLSSCSHFKDDIAPNYFDNNYRNMTFTYIDDTKTSYSSGTLDIFLESNSSLDNKMVIVQGIHKGSINFISENCLLDGIPSRYEGNISLPLKEFLPNASTQYQCIIDITLTPDKIDKKGHDIKEIGRINIKVLPTNLYKPIEISYFENIINTKSFVEKKFSGQASIQLRAGDVSDSRKFFLNTTSSSGTLFIEGCGKSIKTEYYGTVTEILFSNILSNSINIQDSCSIEIFMLPKDEAKNYNAKMDINIYSSDVILLEEPELSIIKKWYSRKKQYLKASSPSYVIATNINSELCVDSQCDLIYKTGQNYWITTITKSGRKRVILYKDGNIIWRNL